MLYFNGYNFPLVQIYLKRKTPTKCESFYKRHNKEVISLAHPEQD